MDAAVEKEKDVPSLDQPSPTESKVWTATATAQVSVKTQEPFTVGFIFWDTALGLIVILPGIQAPLHFHYPSADALHLSICGA